MQSLLQIVSTLIGFATVMLTASLVVMALVRIVQFLGDRRGKTVGEMLAALIRGYRQLHGDAGYGYDDRDTAFIVDVLSFPTLHLPRDIPRSIKSTPGAPAPSDQELRKLTNRVEYLSKESLLAIVDALSRVSGKPELPATWYANLSPEARSLSSFNAYVEQWFETVEAVSSESFKSEARRLTALMSCLVVVAMNIDGFQLASALYHDSALTAELERRAPDVLALAQKRQAEAVAPDQGGRDRLLDGVTGDLRQTNAVLNEPGLELGWQNSWITKAWCKSCAPPGVVVPARTWAEWLPNLARWLAGLFFSCVMLSLGAPFWTDRLKDLLNLRNSMQGKPPPEPEPEPQATAKAVAVVDVQKP
jgi:hypothetical protein